MSRIEHEKGSGNVFADLGYPDADAHLFKAQLVTVIGKLIREQGLTQTVAAERLGMMQPDVSRMLKGQFRSVSVEKLLRCILALGSDVEIAIGRAAGTAQTVAANPVQLTAGALRIRVIELTQDHCRWPVGDPASPDFHFCTEQKVAGLPYCEQHAQAAFRPPLSVSARGGEDAGDHRAGDRETPIGIRTGKARPTHSTRR